jgi:predicted RNase H-like HicB family nuclease
MGKRGKKEKQRKQQRRQFEELCEERLFEQMFEERCEERLQEAEAAAVAAEAAAVVQAEQEKKERDEEGRGRAEAGHGSVGPTRTRWEQGKTGEVAVQRAVEMLAGKIEEMRADAEQREQRSQMLYEVMSEAVGDVSYDTRAVGRSLGRLQLPRVEHGLCLRALEKLGQRWEQQAAKMAGAVEQMREEMGAVQAGQRELALLVHGLGAGVGDMGSGLGGLGSSVRAIQRQLDARTAEQKRLADRVSCWEAEAGGRKISPPATVRKEKGLGGRAGAAGMQGRRLGFGSGREQQRQQQQQQVAVQQAENKEKEQEQVKKEKEMGKENEKEEKEREAGKERQRKEEAAARPGGQRSRRSRSRIRRQRRWLQR